MAVSGGRLDRRYVLAAIVLALLIAAALWLYFGQTDGAGGGGGGGTTTTTTGPSGGPVVLYPTSDLPDGFDLIVVEDHVEVSDGQYIIITEAHGTYRSLVAYGGASVSGNITHGQAVIKYSNYIIPLVAFASTNRTITYDYPGIRIRLDNEHGGFVAYTSISLAIYYRVYEFNVSGTTVYVWLPASRGPTALDYDKHVFVDPVYGVYYINGMPYTLEMISPREPRRGILRAWVVATDKNGTYVFRINP